MSCDDSPAHVFRHVLPFFAMIGSEDLCSGTCRAPLLKLVGELYRIPGLLDCIRKACISEMSAGTSGDSGSVKPDLSPLGWFALTLAQKDEEARKDPMLLQLADLLEASEGPAAKTGRQLRTVLAGTQAAAAAEADVSESLIAIEDIQAGPGGRHDNDHMDYRSIKIIPTASEALCIKLPYLPRAVDPSSLLSAEAALMDRQFRLMREDMMGALRTAISALNLVPQQSPSGFDASAEATLPAPPQKLPSHLQRNVFSLVSVLGVAEKPRPSVMVAIQLPKSHRVSGMPSLREREEFWTDHGRGTLPMDALVCIAGRPTTAAVSHWNQHQPVVSGKLQPNKVAPLLIAFATVGRRDVKELSERFPVIGLAFDRGQEVERVLELLGRGELRDAVLVQISTSFFSVSPLLNCLQNMVSIPLAEELVALQPPSESGCMEPDKVEEELQSNPHLDPTQKEALCSALTQRASLIQGPPGTGKTYVGALVADAIYRRSKETILCVCYTNHALDQFLESLLDKGIVDIVRIGSKSKSKRLEQYNLFQLTGPSSQSKLPTNEYRRLRNLQEQEKELKAKEHGCSGAMDLDDDSSRGNYANKSDLNLVPSVEDEDTTPSFPSDIWGLSPSQRLDLGAKWVSELRAGCCSELSSAIVRCKEVQDEMRSLHDTAAISMLSGKRIIGCTTTGAAKYKDLLQNPKVTPTIVMIEEAGELHESHAITSMSPKTKQLIMIGDHKQLRPKVETYSLSVQSGIGYDLNVSLFERLVVSGFPHVTLGVQHRMHPQISELVRTCTYPDLKDHDSVTSHPELLGLRGGNRVLFLDHNKMEVQEKGPGWGNDTFQSKVNVYEVQMTIAVVNYLLQQGYESHQLVVLTPYLGQLLEIHKALKKADREVTVGDLDMNDLRRESEPQLLNGVSMSLNKKRQMGGNIGNSKAGGGGGIRVATIDNYQGEESDVVVASLVRSNERGSVGFLREPERINVLLSRARHGLIMIGNASTLRGASNSEANKHWGKVLGILEERGSVVKGLPAQCQTHGTLALLDSPESFLDKTPHGGCCLPCKQKLPCGHTCTLKCHSFDRGHENVRCCELVYEFCKEAGHLITRPCWARNTPCKACADRGGQKKSHSF
ncbi:hypothetical protein CEUSTIGMA_g1818.t1 [Chlamydomonas eustigma]|uniref:AAA+ ATPase domain-containing protein n=1 Tax=Chlamydomonas eustigma TaxID=1157962 RepID=A0A250WUI1_9CHLO|nr:hypothetical protein CEUSTIGMA_g1818.t1 [Chlamydomonas eustigma]|eukprot:GAX74369.1 hypothetical protein CEUSTIGMA_g1818.t1 [Chlamydomonas eustigma]